MQNKGKSVDGISLMYGRFWGLYGGISLMYGRFWGLYGGVRLSHLRAYVVLLYAFVYNGLCVYNVYKLILR